jgi:hypothetical protein
VDLGENPYHEFTVHASFSVSPCLNLNFRCRDVAFALLRRKEMVLSRQQTPRLSGERSLAAQIDNDDTFPPLSPRYQSFVSLHQ